MSLVIKTHREKLNEGRFNGLQPCEVPSKEAPRPASDPVEAKGAPPADLPHQQRSKWTDVNHCTCPHAAAVVPGKEGELVSSAIEPNAPNVPMYQYDPQQQQQQQQAVMVPNAPSQQMEYPLEHYEMLQSNDPCKPPQFIMKKQRDVYAPGFQPQPQRNLAPGMSGIPMMPGGMMQPSMMQMPMPGMVMGAPQMMMPPQQMAPQMVPQGVPYPAYSYAPCPSGMCHGACHN